MVSENKKDEYLTATIAYKDYAIPRSALRELSEKGVIGMRTKPIFGGRILKLYKRADIERYLNEQ